MSTKLQEYTKEILPMFRELAKKKELLKDFKESDEKAVELAEAVKESQADLATYIEKDERGAELLEEIKSITKEIKEAIAGAAKDERFKPAELKAYYAARVKDEGVEKVIDKGDLFEELNEIIDGPSE